MVGGLARVRSLSLEELCELLECLHNGRVASGTRDGSVGKAMPLVAPVKWQKLGSFSFTYGEKASGGKGEAW